MNMFRNLKSKSKKRYGGRASDNSDFDDTRFYYCRVCGFANNSDRNHVRKLTSNDAGDEWQSGRTAGSNVDTSTEDVDGSAYWCPFCYSKDSK